MRRHLVPAFLALVFFTVLTVLYTAGTTLVNQLLFRDKANGSLVTDAAGHVVGSELIGQEFTQPQYFHPRPSADAYVAGQDGGGVYSYGSNYGSTNPALIGNVPGVNMDGAINPYANPDDPTCVPVTATDADGNDVTDGAGDPIFATNSDGTYACDPGTVPQRVIAYRAENGLDARVPVPIDAVTASGSGLDPHISVANARLQAARVATTRGVSVDTVLELVTANTDGRALGVLGEPGVNVLRLNLDLDNLAG